MNIKSLLRGVGAFAAAILLAGCGTPADVDSGNSTAVPAVHATPVDTTGAATPAAASNAAPKGGAKVKTKMANGLVIEDLVVGAGAVAKKGDLIFVSFTGALTNGTVVSTSHGTNGPLDFTLGAGKALKGWELGIPGMREGGTRKLIIPGALAYGAKGAPPLVKPNATLVYTIKLVKVSPTA